MPQILSAVFGSRLPKNYNHEKKTHHHLNALPTGFVGQAPSGRSAVFQRQSKRVGRTHRNGERRSGCRRRGQVDVRPFRLLESRKHGGQARHVYIAPVRPVVLELPKGDYTLYAIANLGHDAGERTQDFVRSLRVEREPAALADAPFPMSAQQAVTVRGDTQIAVSLVRAVAKVNFKIGRASCRERV